MSEARRVVITGMAAVSPLGATAEDLWQGLLEGRAGIRRVPRLEGTGLAVTSGGDIDAPPYDEPQRDRKLATRVIEEALAQARLAPPGLGFVWASGLDMFHTVAGRAEQCSAGACFSHLARPFGRPRRMVATACASGTQAIGEAFHLVRAGRVAACVAGASSVILTPFYLVGFSWLQAVALDEAGDDPSLACRPFDRLRRGFALSDGAAALVVESLTSARERGATIIAELRGFGVSQDAFDLTRPPPAGEGAQLCIRRALADAQLEPGDVDAVNAHGTGTRAGDPAEAAAIRAVFADRWQRLPVSSCKGAFGHAMAAAGALEAVAAVRTCASGIVPPTRNLVQPDADCELDHVMGSPRHADARRVLSCSFGMGGQNAALLLARWEG
jgi:3-oxoacyl-[acyl-carrier-protein] synthase II